MTVRQDHPCGGCAFYEGSIWRPVEARALPALKRGFTRKDLAEGQLVYAQGDENRGVLCVSAGLIAVRTLQPDGATTLIKLAYPGDIIGYRSFLAHAPHKTEARALIPSRVCIVAQRDANNVIGGNLAVLKRITSRCVSEIDRNRERIVSASVKSNRDRLRDLLLRLMARHGQRDGDHLFMQLPLSRSDLADLIGVQRETMSRLFRQLKEDGVLAVSGRRIVMPVAAIAERTGHQPAKAPPAPGDRRVG